MLLKQISSRPTAAPLHGRITDCCSNGLNSTTPRYSAIDRFWMLCMSVSATYVYCCRRIKLPANAARCQFTRRPNACSRRTYEFTSTALLARQIQMRARWSPSAARQIRHVHCGAIRMECTMMWIHRKPNQREVFRCSRLIEYAARQYYSGVLCRLLDVRNVPHQALPIRCYKIGRDAGLQDNVYIRYIARLYT